MAFFSNSSKYTFSKLALILIPILLNLACTKTNGQDSFADLLGYTAPVWEVEKWLNTDPIQLSDLKGKVVLLRWWTDGCPYCIASADVLNEFHEVYQDKGLQIIGFYHPKPYPKPVSQKDLSIYTKVKQFEFAIALDEKWKNLKKYWLNGPGRNFTSVSFLLDKKGIIRHIHPGGEYHKDGKGEHAQCRLDYLKLKGKIEQLINE